MALAWSGLFAAFLYSLKRSQSMLLVSTMYCILYFTPFRFTYFKFLRFLMVGIWQTGCRWQVRFVHILYANRNSSVCRCIGSILSASLAGTLQGTCVSQSHSEVELPSH